ncbi:RimK family alpha-L-glutamate ligase [Endozoicomonas sp. ONNA2]|uniref:ATP-grasp domain-containing protein n=1 Tax=Endozoicomonas sp. ONNA2 TaxID=2828741 RepID=UPI002148938A|nr:hypothetical protein [Endozoicomonas sp. ONNA2]
MRFDHRQAKRPVIGLLYLDHVLRFFDKSNFRGWPDRIESVVYHWGNDKQRFINEVKRKKIEVLIGNIPATAYETFRDIARELPEVRFIPSLDSQFANKSKENVTHFCEKYQLPAPATRIFYEMDEARDFLGKTSFPKIIKRSYGPSNYGGYYVHKVDSKAEALELLGRKRYYPVYLQDFIPMKADIRVMLIGHKPVCAFWRRPPKGEWLTNTSQGGTMDYQGVPDEALALAVRASKAANAEYWACDIAVSHDDEYRILECATAFAAFPYIRDWIGQYLMAELTFGRKPYPNIPLYNWEELGKISSSVLRVMRHITFGRHHDTQAMTDTGETFHRISVDDYPLLGTEPLCGEEWPSEQWNRQDNYRPRVTPPLQPGIREIQAAELGAEEVTEVAVAVEVGLQTTRLH